MRGRAQLLASQQKETGAWLSAPPVFSLGLRMSNDAVRIATSFRLGTPICAPHDCSHCGCHIDEFGLHGLSCRKSVGRTPRHSQLNLIIKDALLRAQIPTILEPQGLSCTDGKRPDGMSLIPWSRGWVLVWDATCRNTYAPSHIHLSSAKAGAVAEEAAAQKRRLYAELIPTHHFVPLAFETSGVFSADSLSFLKDLASRSRLLNRDPLAYIKLCQKISITIQRFNCVAILGTCL